mmetsp:Transcript_80097/g.222996  ORF Transcript_80097/g.222996 Transcript_80097/m.222996 type:complete len:206 (-) Transcript_80097:1521-2138(-)
MPEHHAEAVCVVPQADRVAIGACGECEEGAPASIALADAHLFPLDKDGVHEEPAQAQVGREVCIEVRRDVPFATNSHVLRAMQTIQDGPALAAVLWRTHLVERGDLLVNASLQTSNLHILVALLLHYSFKERTAVVRTTIIHRNVIPRTARRGIFVVKPTHLRHLNSDEILAVCTFRLCLHPVLLVVHGVDDGQMVRRTSSQFQR